MSITSDAGPHGRVPYRVVVVGNGMVGQRFVERLVAADTTGLMELVVIGEESRPAYDRVALSSWFDGATDSDLSLVDDIHLAHPRIDYRLGTRVEAIDTDARRVTLNSGEMLDYDHLVLATGSYPFVPPVPGRDHDGCFVYRTIDDLATIKSWATDTSVDRNVGVVIGGGLLGLEAANALRKLDLETHVIEVAPYLMPRQLGEGGGSMLARWITELGVKLHLGVPPNRITANGNGAVNGIVMGEENGDDEGGGNTVIGCDLIVFSAGIRPRDELARSAGLAVGTRGGVIVDDQLATSDPHISAIGEVACHEGMVYGLVAPGYEMAEVLAQRLMADVTSAAEAAIAHVADQTEPATQAVYRGSDLSTKLKLLGVAVASFGDSAATGDGIDELVFSDPISGIYRRLVLNADGDLIGGALVGDVSRYEVLNAITMGQMAIEHSLSALVLPESISPIESLALPDGAQLCTCNNVSVGDCRAAVVAGEHTLAGVKAATTAGTSCGGCVPALAKVVNQQLVELGVEVSSAICEHFDLSRQELFDLIRFHRYTSWSEVVDTHGRGLGCDICRPTVASILASLSNGYILDGEQGSLQDTNDHHLANMQRNGSYSVVPRVPGGEITPRQLITLGEIATDYDLYTKITGGQRIDLFGAQLHQLPDIWRRVVDAGMESGHAYGKALRTVKSCVGSTWCRYGVADSVGMAIRIEQRYRGLRSPHKVKMGVSGCTRECAEAQSKDVGVIATETGWNLYICGNGGRSPRHADLLATDLDDSELIAAIDRFLMFYIRTADRLQRTSSWFEELDGGLDYMKSVVFDDALGINDELEADMARHVEGYECEWKATLADPNRLAHFVEFVNAPDQSTNLEWKLERNQRVPS